MILAAVSMLLVSLITMFRARRFCVEVIAPCFSRAVLWLSGVRLRVHQDEAFPETQTIYVANHTSLIDLYILCALGLPRVRFFMIRECWKILPLWVIAKLMGTFLTPPQDRRDLRVLCFQNAERILRETGDSAYLSPEGERVRSGGIGPFNKGAFHLATNLKAPIIPLFIYIPPELEASENFFILPGSVDVFVLPAVATSNWTLWNLQENKERVRQIYLDFETRLKEGAAPVPDPEEIVQPAARVAS